MTKIYDKLVRDRIPEIIESDGKVCATEILSDDRYLQTLDAKLDEELAEYQESKSLEELAITLAVNDVFMEVDHQYPDLHVHLTLFNASIIEETPQMLEHNDIRWITTQEIPQYTFCPADEEILRRLQSKS